MKLFNKLTRHVLYTLADEAEVLHCAEKILHQRLNRSETVLNSPDAIGGYLQLKLAGLTHEEFWVMWLDAGMRLIACERLFIGTIRQIVVHPREVVKRALHHNACSVIVAHNHPSGGLEPSESDIHLTRQLKDTLALVDVTLADHVLVSACGFTSFAWLDLL